MPLKGEIDKEKLFKKIMPSFAAPEGEDPAGVLPLGEETDVPAEGATAEVAAPPAQAPAISEGAQQQAEPGPITDASATPPAPAPSNLPTAAPEEPVFPVNLPELIIERYYDAYSNRFKCCSCATCRDNTRSLALNQIQPRYVPSNRITEEMLIDREMVTETVSLLIKALTTVKNNPRH